MLKNRKRRPEGGEWEPQISFEIFNHCPKIDPQKGSQPKAIKIWDNGCQESLEKFP
jgi:hypothetical protein